MDGHALRVAVHANAGMDAAARYLAVEGRQARTQNEPCDEYREKYRADKENARGRADAPGAAAPSAVAQIPAHRLHRRQPTNARASMRAAFTNGTP